MLIIWPFYSVHWREQVEGFYCWRMMVASGDGLHTVLSKLAAQGATGIHAQAM